MREIKLKLLTDKVFLLGLIILLTNDLILKYQIGGLLTGKLSDISGLFIFPFFWSIFFERHRLQIYLTTILFFILWKLPLSTDVINLTNQILGTDFQRVVDYCDLLTIPIVPISFIYLNKKIETYEHQRSELRIIPILISLVSLFAFVATSQPRKEIKTKLEIHKPYVIDLSKEEIFKNRIKPVTGLCDSIQANMIDSLFFLEFEANGHDMLAKVKIYTVDNTQTRIDFISMTSYTVFGRMFQGFDEDELKRMETLDKEDYEKIFEREVIQRIKNQDKNESNVFYWNPHLDPRILEGN
jgi:hypothetical protein